MQNKLIKIISALILILVSRLTFSQSNEIIISEYIEGTDNNKAIELYNGTEESYYMLNYYALVRDNNGDNDFATLDTLKLVGELAPGQTFIIAHSLADPSITALADTLVSGSWFDFDGNDQIKLLKNKQELDHIGISGGVYFGKDVTYVREESVAVPTTGEQDPRYNLQWVAFSANTINNLGTHLLTGTIIDSKSTPSNSELLPLEHSQIIPEIITPTATGFGIAGNVGVNLSNGMLNANIPLHTIQLKDYKLPITLNYATKGIKVNQFSSWVGLGWNLHTGGIITRTVKGYPDDYWGDYLFYKYEEDMSYHDHRRKPTRGWLYTEDRYDFDQMSGDIQGLIDESRFDWTNATVWDSQPDKYNFSCGVISGHFYIKPDETVVVSCSQKIKVELIREATGSYNKITGFTITAADGVEYIFGNSPDATESVIVENWENIYGLEFYEYTLEENPEEIIEYNFNSGEYLPIFNYSNGSGFDKMYRYNIVNELEYNNNWYLIQVNTPGGNSISYTYSKGNTVSYVQSVDEFVSTPALAAKESLVLFWPKQLVLPTSSISFSYSQINYQPVILSNISTSNNENIIFNHGETGDIEGIDLLSNFIINKNGEDIYRYNFILEEKSATGSFQKLLAIGNEDKADYRFKYLDANLVHNALTRNYLKTVEFEELSGNNTLEYSFEYMAGTSELPPRYSSHRDEYGYFEVNNVGHTIPNAYISGFDIYSGTGRNLLDNAFLACPSPDNLIDEEAKKAGLLKKIIYPTGAAKEFFYEEYENENYNIGVNITEIRTYPDNSSSDYESVSYVYGDPQKISSPPKSYSYYRGEKTCMLFDESENHVNDAVIQAKLNVISSSFRYPLPTSPENMVWFGDVTEVGKSEGKSEYHFDSPEFFGHQNVDKYLATVSDDYLNSIIPYCNFVPSNSLGKMDEIQHFRNDEASWVKRTDITNNEYVDGEIKYIIPFRHRYYPKFDGTDAVPTDTYYASVNTVCGKTYYESSILDSEVFENGVTINSTKDNTFNNQAQKVSEITNSFSDGSTMKTEVKYSVDYMDINNLPTMYTGSTEAKSMIKMLRKHMINVPIESLAYRNDKIVGGTLMEYQYTGTDLTFNKIYPYKEYKLAINSPIESGFVNSNIDNVSLNYTFEKDTRYELIRTYDKFDSYGNLIQYHDENNINKSFYWDGDTKEYLTAEVLNANWYDIYYNSYEYGEITDNHVSDAHSGEYSLKVLSGEYGISEIIDVEQNREYKLSAWVKTEEGFGSEQANLVIKVYEKGTETVIDGWITTWIVDTDEEWKLFERTVDIKDYAQDVDLRLELWNSNNTHYLLADDIRFHPTDAKMTTSTYKPNKGLLTSKSDVTEKVTSYLYDNFGRLTLIKDNDQNIVEKYSYHHEGEPVEKPDLTISSLNFYDGDIDYSQLPLDVSLRISNNGPASANDCLLGYSTLTTIWSCINSIEIGYIPGYSSKDINLSLDFPEDMPHYVDFMMSFTIDMSLTVDEENEYNNLENVQFKITGTPNDFIDLIITDHELPSNIGYKDQIFNVKLDVSNSGAVNSSPCKLKYYAYINSVWEEIGSIDISSIGAESTIRYNVPIDLTSYTIDEFTTILKYEIDWDSQNSEGDEDNNVLEYTIVLQ